MKKSCTKKESKEVSTTGTHDLSEITEDTKESLSEEQLKINKKLLECGIDEEGLGWLEKRNIYRTISASLDSRDSKRQKQNSSKSTRTQEKWIDNSFENGKNDKTCNNQENQNSTENSRSTSPILSVLTKKSIQGVEELRPSSATEADVKNIIEKEPGNAETQNNNLVKVHNITVELEGDLKEECKSSHERKTNSRALNSGLKRALSAKKGEVSKKLKMEETNNGISSGGETLLKIELEMERRKQSTSFKLRDIKSIVRECEVRNEMWKETYLKNPTPARWGTPIVKNCEKWDGKQIPQKLLYRYQKYLSSNNLTHPVFYPVKSEAGDDLNELSSEVGSQSLTGMNSECRDETDIDDSEKSFMDESGRTLDNNLTASTSGDTTGRMVLRNRSQQKPVILDEEEYSSDEFDDWSSKQKPMKKKKTSGKIKKTFDQNNKQLFLKLEKNNINKRNGSENGRRNENKNDVGFTGGSIQCTNSVYQDSKPGPDPDTMVCPICSLRFKKQLIESHATECASKTYKD